jgi:hypothetical protein
MMARARARVEGSGRRNVTLIEAPVENAKLPGPFSALLFNFVHDVLASPDALAIIFAAAAPNARIACAGMKLFPWWAAPLNLYVLAKARPYMTTFANLSHPWTALAPYVRQSGRETTMLGMGYIAWGYANSNASAPLTS